MQRECTLKQGSKQITRQLPKAFAYVSNELQLKGEEGVWTVIKVGDCEKVPACKEETNCLKISEQHIKALQAINRDHYNYSIDNLGLVVQDLIEDYLIRENGRLGTITTKVTYELP